VHHADHDRAHVYARTIAHDPDPELARALGLPQAGAIGPALPLPGLLDLPLRWVADSPLATALLQVLAAHPATGTAPDHSPRQAFALALTSRAGIGDATPLRASLSGQLITASAGSGWSRDTGLRHLTDALAPLTRTHQCPRPDQAAALRAVALALTDDAPAAEATALRAVAATVTLVESRAKGKAPAGEAIILAVE